MSPCTSLKFDQEEAAEGIDCDSSRAPGAAATTAAHAAAVGSAAGQFRRGGRAVARAISRLAAYSAAPGDAGEAD